MQIFHILNIIFLGLYYYVFHMKKFIKIIILFAIVFTSFSYSCAQQWRWWSRWSSPFQVFNSVVGEANAWEGIQETALDWITDLQGSYPRQYKITNTLDYIRQHISPYIQWAVYVWFIASTAWLIICWFLLVTWWIWKSSGFEKVKWKIVNALLGVFILSWFYLFIKLIVWIINTIFWW